MRGPGETPETARGPGETPETERGPGETPEMAQGPVETPETRPVTHCTCYTGDERFGTCLARLGGVSRDMLLIADALRGRLAVGGLAAKG